MNENWNEIKKFFEEKLGMPAYIADYVAVFDVLVMALSGLSVDMIAKDTQLNVEDVKDILNEFLNFNGWNEQQSLNYWFVYNQTDSKESFQYFIQSNLKNGKIDIEIDSEKIYTMCMELKRIREELNEWYN